MWLLKRLWLLEAPEKPEGMDVQGVCPGCLLPSLSLWGALSGLPRLGQGAPAPGVLPELTGGHGMQLLISWGFLLALPP